MVMKPSHQVGDGESSGGGEDWAGWFPSAETAAAYHAGANEG